MTDRFTAVVIDDEPLASEGLRRLLERSGAVEVLSEARDGEAGLALIEELAPQSVFLDIAMPRLNGLEVASRLSRSTRAPKIVLVTAHDHYATEAFDLAVVDYILKPLVAERVDRAIERLRTAIVADRAAIDAALWVPFRGTVVRLAVAAIHHVAAERDYVRLHDAERSYLLRATVTDLIARLDPAGFVRIHRSTIVAVDRISGLRHVGGGAWAVIDLDGEEMPVGRSYLTALRNRIGWQG